MNFQEILEQYGVNYKETMERFVQDEEMYVRLLDLVVEDENLAGLKTALDQQDLSAAFEFAHTIKGVAGNMGLTPYYNSICKIVEPLRIKNTEVDYSVLYQDIVKEFEKVKELKKQLS